MRILKVEPAQAARWDSYVECHPNATFFHRYGWERILRATLGHPTIYLAAERDGRWVGVLPLAHVRSALFGSTLSALPFCSYGGALADDADARAALESEAVQVARILRVDALELRNREPGTVPRPTKRLYDTFAKPIAESDEANLQAIRGKQRNIIRKAGKAGLVEREDEVEGFYRIYARSLRDLGTPVFPVALFAALRAQFPADTEFLSVCLGNDAIASTMLFYYRDTVCPYYWGSDPRARTLGANDFLCWRVMSRAIGRGCTWFDFGRSKQGTGSYQWKVNLGFEARPLFYEYELVRAREMPNVNPLNPKYRLFIELWKRLPLPIANFVGPLLARKLG